MSPLEIVANVANLLSVYLAARNHVLTWGVGILGGILYGVMFFRTQLYADVSLQVFFLATSVWGWWNWVRGAKGNELPVTRAGGRIVAGCMVGGIAFAVAYGAILHYATDASLPFIDSVILAFSVIAQILMMRRNFEHWIFWIIVDIVAVPLYAYKELYLTAAVYAIFLVNAIWGLSKWRRLVSARV
ncbi:MAG: nicotinamide riboside transporter PnuC [Bdellovibrionota bacterium]